MIRDLKNRNAARIKKAGVLGITGIVLVILAGMIYASCGGNSNRANILPPDVQYMADTMLSHRKRMIKAEMDSLCQKEKEALIARARDSIVAIEESQIRNIIGNE